MKKTYEVVGPAAVGGFEKGWKGSGDKLPTGTNLEALVAGGHLKVVAVEKAACPACAEQKIKSPPKFDSYDELRAHYAEKHAGLEPPREEE